MPGIRDTIHITSVGRVQPTAAASGATVTITVDGTIRTITIPIHQTCPVGHSIYAPYRVA
jgi:hypothetical protein